MNTSAPFLPVDRDRLRSQSFTRAAYAIALDEAGGIATDIETYVRAAWEHDNRVARITRGATSPADTSATAIAASAVSDFVGSLAPISGAARLVAASALRLRDPGATSVTVPWISDLTGAGFVDEGDPVPVLQGEIVPVEVSTTTKIAFVLSLTNQLLKSSNAEIVFEALLRRAAALALDAALFSTTAGSTTQPAGLLAGVTPTAAGMTLDDDLMSLADAIVAAGGDGSVIFVTSPGRALRAQALAPNAELPVYGSSAVASTSLIAICANAFASVIAAPEIRASREATVHTDTVPTQLGVSSTAVHTIRSMFQTDTTALMCILKAGWNIAPGLVQFVSSPAW